MSQANRYLGGFCSSQRIFPPQIIQVLLVMCYALGLPLKPRRSPGSEGPHEAPGQALPRCHGTAIVCPGKTRHGTLPLIRLRMACVSAINPCETSAMEAL